MSDLRFTKLTLENFKTFAGDPHEIDLDQKPGLYFVQGKNLLNPELGANGVGKSTLFDAILWVLFNKTGRDARPAAAITPWGKKGMTRVHLKFMRGDEEIEIVRTRNPNHLELYEDEGPREIQQEDVPGILGMSEEMLRRTLILGQFGTLFLDERPERQAQMFTEALSLDIWLKAVDAAGSAAKASAAMLRDIEIKQSSNDALLLQMDGQIIQFKEASETFEKDRERRLDDLKEKIEDQDILIGDILKKKVEKPEQPSRAALDALNKEIQPIREKWAVAASEFKRLGQDTDAAENIFDDARKPKVEKKCSECGQSLTNKQHEDHLYKLEKTFKDLLAKLEAKKAEIDALDAEGKKVKEKIDAAQADYDKAIRAMDRKLSIWDEWQRGHDRATIALADMQRDLKKIAGESNIHKKLHADAIQSRADLRTRKVELAASRKHEELIEAEAKLWVEAFRELRLSIIDETLIELEMAASRHMAMLGLDDWGIKFETEREAKSGSVSYSFTVLLYPPGRNEAVKWESYSGGESQRIQLAVAFGLSEVLLARAGLKPNLEVLDEPTRGLSPQGIEDLIEHLRDRALELERCIFLIEHHSLDKGSFDGVITIIKDKKGARIVV